MPISQMWSTPPGLHSGCDPITAHLLTSLSTKSLRVGIATALLAGLRLLATDAPPPPTSLRITLLGTGNPRPTSARVGPATMVEAGG
jgi:hypothetical protein